METDVVSVTTGLQIRHTCKQESCAITKMTTRCALCMNALKVLGGLNPNLGEEEVIGGRGWNHSKEHGDFI